MVNERNETNLAEYETNDLDVLILNLLGNQTFLKRGSLIEEIEKIMNQKRGKSKKKKEYLSKATLHRHLDYLLNTKQIIRINHKDFVKFGIPSTKKREGYYTLQIYEQIPRYYDLVISSLKSKDPIKKKSALIEIESMGKIKLLPIQLTELSNLLLKEDYLITQSIIRILYNNFIKLSYPSNLEKFQDNLIKYYAIVNKNLREENITQGTLQSNRNTKASILFILGVLKNHVIIEFLKDDLLNSNKFDELLEEGYRWWALAPIIESHRADLLEFQNKLPLEPSRLTLLRIRAEASKRMNESYHQKSLESMYETRYIEYKKGLMGKAGGFSEIYEDNKEN